MLRDFTWTEKYEEAMLDEHPPQGVSEFLTVSVNAGFGEQAVMCHTRRE